MRLPRVPVRVRRDVSLPPEVVYAWMTDLQEDDPARAGSVVRRRKVLERAGDRVLLEEDIELLGVTGRNVLEVRLLPPRAWTATIMRGPGRGSRHRYEVLPRPGGAQVRVRYGIQTRRLRTFVRLWLARGRLRHDLGAMWDGFVRALEEDAASGKATRAERAA